jgi:hypothetical protein
VILRFNNFKILEDLLIMEELEELLKIYLILKIQEEMNTQIVVMMIFALSIK